MSFENMPDKLLVERMRFISDRLSEIKAEMDSLIQEYDELGPELVDIINEVEERNGATKEE